MPLFGGKPRPIRIEQPAREFLNKPLALEGKEFTSNAGIPYPEVKTQRDFLHYIARLEALSKIGIVEAYLRRVPDTVKADRVAAASHAIRIHEEHPAKTEAIKILEPYLRDEEPSPFIGNMESLATGTLVEAEQKELLRKGERFLLSLSGEWRSAIERFKESDELLCREGQADDLALRTIKPSDTLQDIARTIERYRKLPPNADYELDRQVWLEKVIPEAELKYKLLQSLTRQLRDINSALKIPAPDKGRHY